MRIFLYEFISAGGFGGNVPPSLRREGWAMLSAVVEDFQRLNDVEVVTLIDGQFPGTLGDDCRRNQTPGAIDPFRESAADCDWTLVIAPEFDDLLLTFSQGVIDVGGRLLGSSPHAIRIAADKLTMASMWNSHGVPTPRTDVVDPIEFVTFGPPWVIKPRYGAGSQATFLIHDKDEKWTKWNCAQKEWAGELIAQKFIHGEAASVAFLVGPRHMIPLLPARQHLSGDGRFRYLGGSQAVACIPGLHGYVGVDATVTARSANDTGSGIDLVLGEKDVAIEINPRLTTSYIGLRQQCRQNVAELMLRCACGEIIEAPTNMVGWRDSICSQLSNRFPCPEANTCQCCRRNWHAPRRH